MKFFGKIVVILFLLGFVSCQEKTNTANVVEKSDSKLTAEEENKAVETKTIVFFGTSLTAGYGLSEDEAYPNLIQQKLTAQNKPYKVVNAGLSGETTTDGINRIDWVLRQKVDVFALELGANDALRGQPVENAAKNMQGILDAVKAKYPECKLMIIGMMAPPNLGSKYTSDFQKIFPTLAQNNKAAFVPFLLDGVAGNPALNQADGIHPTAEGQKILTETVWKELETVLE